MHSVGACFLSEWILAIIEQQNPENNAVTDYTPMTNQAALRHKKGGSVDMRQQNAKMGLMNLYKPYEPTKTTKHSRNTSLTVAKATPRGKVIANTGKHVMFKKEISVIDEEPAVERLFETTN